MRQSFDFFGGLGLRGQLKPMKRPRPQQAVGVGDSVYNAVVSDGRTKVELVSFPWVESVRNSFKKPPAGQLMAVGLRNAAKDRLPSKFGSFSTMAFLQPLAWLDAPSIHPFVFSDTEEEEEEEEEGQAVDSELCPIHVKEIVFGEADDRLFESGQLFRDLSPHCFIPGLTTFGDPSQGYSSIAPAVRVLSSPHSALIFKVPDLDTACTDISRLIGHDTRPDSYSATSPSKADKFARVPVPFLHGLSIRLSESEEYVSRYFEPDVSAREREDNSVEFE